MDPVSGNNEAGNEDAGQPCRPTLCSKLKYVYDMFITRKHNSEKPLLVLCGIADLLYDYDAMTNDISESCLGDGTYWNIVQCGLHSADSMTRKRAMYLLKRSIDILETACARGVANDLFGLTDDFKLYVQDEPCIKSRSLVFVWRQKDVQKQHGIWTDFILLMEMLEETQVHVIKPVMPLLKKLQQAAISKDLNETTMFPSSWLAVVFKRIKNHESNYVYRWGISELLDVNISNYSMLEKDIYEVLTKDLVEMLKESHLYYRQKDSMIGSPPTILPLITRFFKTCLTAHMETAHMETAHMENEDETFLATFLKNIIKHHWGGPQLFYVIHCLSSVGPTPVLDKNSLNAFGKVLKCTIRLHPAILKHAMKMNITKCLTNLYAKEKLSLSDIMEFLPLLDLKRGTEPWKRIVSWIQTAVSTDKGYNGHFGIRRFLQINVSDILQNWAGTGRSFSLERCYSVALIILICHDADLIPVRSPDMSVKVTVSSLIALPLYTLSNVNSRPYLCLKKVDTAIGLLVSLIDVSFVPQSVNSELDQLLKASIDQTASECLIYIRRRIWRKEDTSLEVLDVYITMLTTVMRFSRWELYSSALGSMVEACITYLLARKDTDAKMAHLFSMETLKVVLQYKDKLPKDITEKITKAASSLEIVHDLNIQNSSLDLEQDQAQLRKLSDRYIQSQWYVIGASLALSHHIFNASVLLNICTDAMDVHSGKTVDSLLGCFQLLIKTKMVENVPELLTICWRKMVESQPNETYKRFLEMLFMPIIAETSSCSQVVKTICHSILETGCDKPGFVFPFSCAFFHWLEGWIEQGNGIEKEYVDIAIRLLTYEPSQIKALKLLSEVYSYMETQDFNITPDRSVNDGPMTRGRSIAFLTKLISLKTQLSHQLSALLTTACIEAMAEASKQKNYKNFPNSQLHHRSHRLVTTLLILTDSIQEGGADKVAEFIMKRLANEPQPSVRMYLEWAFMKLLNRFPSLEECMWHQFQDESEKKPTFTCSLIIIVNHLANLMDNRDNLANFLTKLMTEMLAWCMDHHFNVRLHAQVALHNVWAKCKQHGLEKHIESANLIEKCLSHNFSKATNVTQKLMSYFVLSEFHPIKDYSLETIFYTVPKLLEISSEEWITPDAISSSPCIQWVSDIPLYNERRVLDLCQPGVWRIREIDHEASDEVELQLGDVQKKVIPWRFMLPSEENREEFPKKGYSTTDGLIVVTSLIDKVANLGGLCRTSEVFRTSEFVVNNIKCVEDKVFQTLSVTAHKWLPITEVPTYRLKSYFLEKKAEGYMLVGGEQTANSLSFTDYTFPKKTLLLLGNEKEGIPVEMIQMLDSCIEIPQQGVIRSLNVHVSGALLIWEYTRQQMIGQQA